MPARLIVGDVLEVLRTLPDDSVDLCLTSSPFLALRSYLPQDHPDKSKELGSEPTPGAFIDAMLDVVEEVRRVLAPHGSLVWELGDTYAGSGGAGGDYGPVGLREGQPTFDGSAARVRTPGGDERGSRRLGATSYPRRDITNGWPQDKSLTLVPELFRIALAYGVNPLTGRTTEPWRIRNVIRWVRPNPPVGALGDKFRPATSEMVVATMSRTRYFDLDAVRAPTTAKTCTCCASGWEHSQRYSGNGSVASKDGNAKRADSGVSRSEDHPAGAPPLDWWAIPTEPFSGSHYATFPRELCVKPIRSMCPERVCRVCGEPSRRVVEQSEEYAANRAAHRVGAAPPSHHAVGNKANGLGSDASGLVAEYRTTGWTDCGHDDYRPGVVLDPFAGSGTTLAVATGHGRDAIGIDLDERNADLAMQRCGMFLTVEHHDPFPIQVATTINVAGLKEDIEASKAGLPPEIRNPKFRAGTPRWDGRPEGQKRTKDYP